MGSDGLSRWGRVSGAVFFGDGGADGLLWIREYPDPFQDQVTWVGFSEAWERKKRIAMPAGLRVLDIMDISEDRVLVRAKGAHDETLIEVYPIER